MNTKVIGCVISVVCGLNVAAFACTHNVTASLVSVSPTYSPAVGHSITVTVSAFCDYTGCTPVCDWEAFGAYPNERMYDSTSFTCSYNTVGTKTITMTAHCPFTGGDSDYVYVTINVVDEPVVENRLPIIDVDNGVTLRGEVTHVGSPAPYVKIFYGTNDCGEIEGLWSHEADPDPAGTKTGSFSAIRKTDLEEGTTYFFRCKAWNIAGADWDTNETHSSTNPERPIKFITAPGKAILAEPSDGEIFERTTLSNLAWEAGTSSEGTPEHRIYFGQNYSQVVSADTSTFGIYKGQQTGTETSFPVTDTLVRGQTYYWRIDEVIDDDSDPDNEIERVRKGQIWSFAISSTFVDDDNDYMDDEWELQHGVSDPAGNPDNDGLNNLQEYNNGTNPKNNDTDGDDLLDGDEINEGTSPVNPDHDGDGITDGWEINHPPLDPLVNDSSTIEFHDIPAIWWFQYGIEPIEANLNQDPDSDGLVNSAEFTAGTNPQNYDTDGDGVDDKWEVDYKNNFYVEGVQDALNPVVYDADDKKVGLIPATWWYDWWKYCVDNANGKQIYFVPTSENASEDDDLDNDGLDNLDEYQNGSSPLEASIDDYWTVTIYDDLNNTQKEKQYVYYEGNPSLLAETIHEFDNLGRQWRTRQLATPGTASDSEDAITLTEYYVDGSVKRTIQKGYDSGSANMVDDDYEDGDVQTVYTYDALGRQYTVTDPMDNPTTYNYDTDDGLLNSVTLPSKEGVTRTLEYRYDGAARQYATINPEGNYEVKTFDSLGHVIKSMLYETVGEIDAPLGSDTNTSTADVAVSQRRMEYDNLGTLTKNIVMANASSDDAYSTETDQVTVNVIEYDSINKAVSTITYSGLDTIADGTWSYTDVDDDASGRGLPTEIWKGEVPEDSSQPMIKQFITYNASGQVIIRVTSHFDQFVNRTTQYDPDVSTMTKMEYDSYGRLIASVADPDSNTSTTDGDLRTEFSYWGSQKLTQTDPEQNVTRFEYNAFGHMKKKTEAYGTSQARVTEYEYDRLGNLISLTADDGDNTATSEQITLYTYDLTGNVTEIEYPDNGTITYIYADPAAGGRPTQRTDQNQVTTKYTYDKMGNLIQKQNAVSNPTIVETYTYDARGLMLTAYKGTSATAPNNTSISAVEFKSDVAGNNSYDGLEHVGKITQQIKGGTPRTIDYTHNQIGKVTKLTYPTTAATQIGFSYTSLGMIDEIVRNPNGTPDELVDYDYAGTLVVQRLYDLYKDQYENHDVTLTVDYDEFGRISDMETVGYGTGQGVYFEYTYDNNSNIDTQIFNHRTNSPYNDYNYDELNRVTEADYLSSAGQTFDYDLLGNRNSVLDERPVPDITDTYGDNNAVNEYIKINSETQNVFHDAAGNLIEDHRGYSYIYDYENRLIQIYIDDNLSAGYDAGDTNIAEFTYDALGRRIEMVAYNNSVNPVTSTTTRYYYDDQRVLLETAVAGTETDVKYYVWGNYIDELLVMHNMASGGYDYVFSHDHLYSPVIAYYGDVPALRMIEGTSFERYEYDAYGTVTVYPDMSDWDTSAPTTLAYSNCGNPYTFTGRQLDKLDGGDLYLMHYRARAYDPQTGRFMQRDPLDYIDSMNLYKYVSNNPVINKDPLGLVVIFEPPYTDKECEQLNFIMLGRYLLGDKASATLFDWWAIGKFKNQQEVEKIPMEWFDPGGLHRATLKDKVIQKLFEEGMKKAKGLPCNTSSSWFSSQLPVEPFVSSTRMITVYRIHTAFTYYVTRKCDSESCCYMQVDTSIGFRATDYTDFNENGDVVRIPGTDLEIPDEMYDECYKNHADFYILGTSEIQESFAASCE